MIWIFLAFGANFISCWIRNADPDPGDKSNGEPDPKHWSWQPDPGSLVLPILFCLFSSACLVCLSCSACPVCLSCSACYVLPCSAVLSCPSFPLLVVCVWILNIIYIWIYTYIYTVYTYINMYLYIYIYMHDRKRKLWAWMYEGKKQGARQTRSAKAQRQKRGT